MNRLDINDRLIRSVVASILVFLTGCASGKGINYHDPNMDFGSIRTVAVMPFSNLTTDKLAAERVRDTFINHLIATGVVYVIPPGEVARGVARTGIADPEVPASEDIKRLAAIIKADAVITGVVSEYGVVRSGTISANVVSFSLQMLESQTQKTVWSASTTKGGISLKDRMFGGGGEPMSDVVEAAANEIIDKLFRFEGTSIVEQIPAESAEEQSEN